MHLLKNNNNNNNNFVILSNCMRIGGMAASIFIGAIGAVRNCLNIVFNALF
jgi:hypothetical protein